jgi:hypothetical protein
MTLLTLSLSPAATLFSHWRGWFASARDERAAPSRAVAEEAAAVRALADTYRRSDPSFASDLYAAADRYERENEAAATR